MPASMMKAIGAAIGKAWLFGEGKGVDVASEKKSGLFIGVIGLEGDNYSGEFVGGGLDEVEAGNFGEIVFDELWGFVLFEADFGNLM